MAELRDFVFETVSKSTLTEAKKEDQNFLGNLKFRFAKGDEKNHNGRIYSSDILRREVVKMNKKIKEMAEPQLAQLDHPTEGGTDLSKASHLLTSLAWKNEKKEAYAEAKILNTTSGKDLLRLLKSGSKLGASMRGSGTLNKDGRVESDYSLLSVDVVHKPSFGSSASVTSDNLFESVNPKIEEKLQSEYTEAERAGYRGTFEEFQKMDEKDREYSKKDFEELQREFVEAQLAGYQGSFEDWQKTYKGE